MKTLIKSTVLLLLHSPFNSINFSQTNKNTLFFLDFFIWMTIDLVTLNL